MSALTRRWDLALSSARTSRSGGNCYQEQSQDLFRNLALTWTEAPRAQQAVRLKKTSRQGCSRQETIWVANQDKPLLQSSAILTKEIPLATGFWRACKDGQVDRALAVLLLMEEKGLLPSVHMHMSLLKACARKKALAQAKQVHAHLAGHDLNSTSLLECLVSTLVKCGDLHDAMQLFHTLPHQTLRSWTAVICGHTSAGQGREALRLYHRMRVVGRVPDEEILVSVLRACGTVSDLEEGKSIHDDVLKLKLTFNLFVGTSLIDMYGRCGSIVDARAVFDELAERTVVSWNSMLTAYCRQGQPEKALQLYEQMLEEGVSPNDRTLVGSLQACCMLGDNKGVSEQQMAKVESLVKGKEIHAYAYKKGYATDVFVGNALINMYGRHRSSVEAWSVIEGLTHRDIVSWNTMLAAYVQQGQGEKALQVYGQLREEGTSVVDVRTFVSVLQACGMPAENEDDVLTDCEVKFLAKGKAIHAEAQRLGFGSDMFVGSTVITMYAKLGSIADAETVFQGLSQRNVVSWNAMLAAYVQEGQADEVLHLYRQMLEECASVSELSFVSVLQACALLGEKEEAVSGMAQSTKAKSLQLGKLIHAAASRNGYHEHVVVSNTLVSMYGKCESIEDARLVFDAISRPNVVSWNAMLAAYAHQGQGAATLRLYRQMQEEGNSIPNDRTLVTALQACGMVAENEASAGGVVDGKSMKVVQVLEAGKAIHADAWMRGYCDDIFVANTLVSMYGKCGSIEDAKLVFEELPEQSVVAWTAMLSAHVEQRQPEAALQLYKQMKEAGICPDDRAFVCALQACGMLAEQEQCVIIDGQCTTVTSLGKGKAIHAEAKRLSYDSYVFVRNALMSMYGKCGSLADAQQVFDGLHRRDVVAWNVLLSAHVEQGQQGGTALQVYRQMQAEDVNPNEITFMCILQACSNTGSLDMCRHIHHTLAATASSSSSSSSNMLANTLIHAYGSCGSMVDAQTVFDTLPQPDVVSWTALISGHARQGDFAASMHCYDSMLLSGVSPDPVTFLSLLSACSHAGLVDRGAQYLESMSREHGLAPEMEHYVCMVDLLGRAGLFSRVEDLLSIMPMQPNLSLWLCLLGACRMHGNVVLGEESFHAAVQLQPKHAGTYVLMWNIYSDAGLLEQANEVMEMRQKAGAWKKPGQSWSEHGQSIRTFMVKDQEHLQQVQLYHMLKQLR